MDEIKPQDGELVINKVSASAFFNSSGIDQILRNMDIDGLVIIGVGFLGMGIVRYKTGGW